MCTDAVSDRVNTAPAVPEYYTLSLDWRLAAAPRRSPRGLWAPRLRAAAAANGAATGRLRAAAPPFRPGSPSCTGPVSAGAAPAGKPYTF